MFVFTVDKRRGLAASARVAEGKIIRDDFRSGFLELGELSKGQLELAAKFYS